MTGVQTCALPISLSLSLSLSLCLSLSLSLFVSLSPLPQASVGTVQLWVSGILAILRVLVSQSTEDIVLSRVHELSLSPSLLSCPAIRRLHLDGPAPPPPGPAPPGGPEANGETQRVPPEETFAR